MNPQGHAVTMGRDLERVSPTKDPLATAVLMFFVGLIMAIMGFGAITIVVVFAGVMLIVYGSSYLSRGFRGKDSGNMVIGILAAIVGLLLVVVTGLMTLILAIIVALFLMVLGVLAIVSNIDAGGRRRNVALVVGILMIIIGVVLLVWPGATSDLAVRVIGVVIAVVSALSIYSYVR